MNKLMKQLSLVVTLLLLSAAPTLLAQNIFINEWMAKNSATIDDEAGEYDDWIELYNAGSTAVDLNGFYLTDDISNSTKFQITTTAIIPPMGHLLFWADNDLDQGDLHLNFKLSASGETIALFSPSEELVDSVTFGAQNDDLSNGRYPDGSNSFFLFDDPTPGSTNLANGSTGFVASPVFNFTGGFYDNSLTVEITSATPGAAIYYTLDGEDPSTSAILYTGSFTVSSSTIVRAFAVNAGLLDSKFTSHSYFIQEAYELPVLSLMTDPDNMFGPTGIYTNPNMDGSDWERFCQMEYFKDENLAFAINAGIRIQGNSSVGLPKKSFRLFFESEYGAATLEYPMFDGNSVTSFKNLVLRAGYDDDITTPDGTLLRDPISNIGYRQSGGLISDGNWAVLLINGVYWGIYEIRESINEEFIESHTGWDDFDMIRFKNSGPELKNGTMDDWNTMTDFIMNNDFSDPANYAQAETIFDIDNLVNFLAYGHCTAYHSWSWGASAYKENTANGKWEFTVWDLDRGISLLGWDPFGDYGSSNPSKWCNFIPEALTVNETFRNKTINRTADLLNTIYLPDAGNSLLLQEQNKIVLELPREFERWNDTLNMVEWEDRVSDIERFFNLRPNLVRNYVLSHFALNDTNELNLDVNGNGQLHLNTIDVPTYPWAGIYFEGVPVRVTAIPDQGYIFAGWSDPSLPNQASIELDFTGTYNLTANFVQGSVATDPIVINEINYHSPDATDAGDWIELYNPTNAPVDISGWVLQDEGGDAFKIATSVVIPAQSYVVMANERAQFLTVYPSQTNLIENLDEGSFKLANSGEKIYLRNANDVIIDAVAYDDQTPWPIAADGDGPSLQLIDASSNNNVASNWIAILPTPNTVNCQRLTQNQLPGDIVTGLSTTNVSCVGETDGAINLTASGAGLTYRWSNTVTSEDLEDVAAGNYEVLVISETHCENIVDLTITSPTPITTTAQVSTTICHAANNGSISLSSVGGTGNYAYLWNSGATTASLNNLTANTYQVTITDAMNCQITETYEITASPEIVLTETVANLSCFDAQDGSIGLTITGGSGGFNYLWSTSATTATINNLLANNYAVTVTDAANCSAVENFEITAPTALSLTKQVNSNDCFGEESGSIAVSVTGGTGAYTYLWSNAATTAMIDALAANTYTVTVTDAANCNYIESFEITTPTMLDVEASIQTIVCHGNADGQIALNVTGGTNGYTYLWNTNATTSMIEELVADTYTVTITDAANCQRVESYEVATTAMIATNATINPILCNGANDGSIELAVTGGNSDYTYLWNTNATTAMIDNLAAAAYTVTVTDGAGCEDIATFEITEATALTAEANTTNIACNGEENGSIDLTPTGGAGTYTYLWSNGLTTSSLTDLAADNYTVTITDAANCIVIESYEISAPPVLTSTVAEEHISCFNGADGSINLNVSGGTGTYNYAWSNGATTAMVNELTANEYMVTITDAANCSFVENITLTQAPAIVGTAAIDHLACFGDTNGSIVVTASGGTGTLSYTWDNNENGNSLENLLAGAYELTITDDNDCKLVETHTILSPTELVVTSTVTQPTPQVAGTIQLEIMGGVIPYQIYLDETLVSNIMIEELGAGTYSVKVLDANGCSHEEEITLSLTTSTHTIESLTNFEIYPNPSNGNFELNFATTQPQTFKVSIYNTIGQQFFQQRMTGKAFRVPIQLAELPQGIYYLSIRSEEGLAIQKLIIK